MTVALMSSTSPRRSLRVVAMALAVAMTLSVAATPVAAGPRDRSTTVEGARERPPTAASLYEDGELEFRAGNIDAAIELFSRGYALEPRAEFLLNLAQCYRALGRRTEAIQHFERFIKAAPEHPLRQSAEKTLEELRRAETVDRIALTPRPVQPLAPPPQAPPPAPARSRAWIWITAGALAVVGGGAAVYVATRAPGVDDTIRLPPP